MARTLEEAYGVVEASKVTLHWLRDYLFAKIEFDDGRRRERVFALMDVWANNHREPRVYPDGTQEWAAGFDVPTEILPGVNSLMLRLLVSSEGEWTVCVTANFYEGPTSVPVCYATGDEAKVFYRLFKL